MVQEAYLHGGLFIAAQHLVHFPRKPKKRWMAVIPISDQIFYLPVFKVDDGGCPKAWSAYKQGIGMSCLGGIIFLDLGVVRLPSFYSRDTWSSCKTDLTGACRKDVTFHIRGRWKYYLFVMLISSE